MKDVIVSELLEILSAALTELKTSSAKADALETVARKTPLLAESYRQAFGRVPDRPRLETAIEALAALQAKLPQSP